MNMEDNSANSQQLAQIKASYCAPGKQPYPLLRTAWSLICFVSEQCRIFSSEQAMHQAGSLLIHCTPGIHLVFLVIKYIYLGRQPEVSSMLRNFWPYIYSFIYIFISRLKLRSIELTSGCLPKSAVFVPSILGQCWILHQTRGLAFHRCYQLTSCTKVNMEMNDSTCISTWLSDTPPAEAAGRHPPQKSLPRQRHLLWLYVQCDASRSLGS